MNNEKSDNQSRRCFEIGEPMKETTENMNDETKTNHFNNLSPAEDERLALVSEECAEVIQIICKIQRHGYDSYHPDDDDMNNRGLLEKELGDLQHVIERLMVDLTPKDVKFWKDEKAKKIVRYLHHQPDGEGGQP